MHIVEPVGAIVAAEDEEARIYKSSSVTPATRGWSALRRHESPSESASIQLPYISEQTLIIASSKQVDVMSESISTVARAGLRRGTLKVGRGPNASLKIQKLNV